ncbi:MAG: hypothetical protein IKO93_03815, partial [Lentisphaeria bacterium]|nr:hypothetical protein [Lentisphaeria bacterium]
QAAAELKAMQARKTANDMAIADSNRIIAAKQAETAAIIAEEEKVIAAQHGRRGKGAVQAVQMAQQKIRAAQNEAAATVAAETEKQAAIKKTNIELAAQISAQNRIAAAAAKSATAATAAAAKAAADYSACAKSAAAATAAETRLTLAKEIANKKDLARGALLSKIITMKKFRIAYTQREAAVIWATSIKSIAAAKAEAGASWLKTAGYYAEAVGAKVAAGATLMLNKAMLLVAANPVTAALIALAAGIYACRKAVALSEDGFAREAEAAKKAAAAIEERRAAGDRQRAQQQDDFRRLQQLQELARQGKITDDQMKEAATLAEDLQNVYGDLGIAVDSATKSITMMAQAQERLNQAMREKALQELGEEIEKQKQLILKLGDSLAGGVRHFFSSDLLGKDTETDEYTTLFGIDSVAKHDAPIKKQMADERKKLQGMYDRLKALRGGDKGAITGAGSTSQDRIAATEAEQKKKAEVAGYTDYLKNRDKKSEADRAGRALDKRFDKLDKDKSAAGRQVMSDFMAMLDNGLAAARREYQRKLQEAQSESSEKGADLSKGEKAELKRLQQTIDGMTEKIAGYRERIADGMAAAQAQVKTVSGFDAQGLMQMFGRKSERDVAAERTAKATEKSEKYLKDLVSKYSQGWAIS